MFCVKLSDRAGVPAPSGKRTIGGNPRATDKTGLTGSAPLPLFLRGARSVHSRRFRPRLGGAAGRLGAAFVRPVAFLGATADFDFLAGLVRARFRPGLAAAVVAFLCAADFRAALAFLSAAHRFFVAAIIRARPSGLRRRFFLAALAALASPPPPWFPHRRPPLPQRGGHAPARGGAHWALGSGGGRGRSRRDVFSGPKPTS